VLLARHRTIADPHRPECVVVEARRELSPSES
jgi:hypothetical protein